MPTSLTLTRKVAGGLDELRPHVGLYPRVGLYPNPNGLSAHSAGALTLAAKSSGALTLTPRS